MPAVVAAFLMKFVANADALDSEGEGKAGFVSMSKSRVERKRMRDTIFSGASVSARRTVPRAEFGEPKSNA